MGRDGRLASRSSRSKKAGSEVEGGSLAGAAGATAAAVGRPDALPQVLNHTTAVVARTLDRSSCAVTGGEFNGRRLLFSSNPVSPPLGASGAVVPSSTVKHQVDLSSSFNLCV